MPDYAAIISAKYPAANFSPLGGNVELVDWTGFEGRGVEITRWELPDPQPALAELDAYAASIEYHTARAVLLKAAAEVQVNAWANQAVMNLKILEPELFYVAMVANVAFRLLEWNTLGKPEEVDPLRFIVTHSEAQAYAETSAPAMTPAELLRLQETRWNQMQQGFAAIVYKRRLALEKIKLAPPGENLETELGVILAELLGES